MKLRVVAWGCYDDDLPEGDNGWAARNAIIDDIRKNEYDFSGWSHQEGENCAPILNDGKKYLYSQRGWGDVMSEAHGLMGEMDYAKFMIRDEVDEMFGSHRDRSHRPVFRYFDESMIETDLNETFERSVKPEQFERAKRGTIKFADYESLRYLYKGDTLVLVCGEERAAYLVEDAYRQHITKKEEWTALRAAMENEKAASAHGPRLALNVTLKPLTK